MRYAQNKKLLHISLAFLLTVGGLTAVPFVQRAHAATMEQVFVRFDRMKVNTTTTGTVCINPGTSSNDVKTWTVTFPDDYTVSNTVSNWQTTNISTDDLAWPDGAEAWPNATSATASVNGQTVTWTNASAQTMNNDTLYCYNWTNSAALTVKSGAGASNIGTVATQDSNADTIDEGSFATASITDDQIVVTATVPVAFSFALSGNTDELGDLSSSTIASSPTPRTATINTNAKNGWMVWARDTNAGLTSASASYTIESNCSGGTGSNSTLSPGTEGYNLGVTDTQAGGEGAITVNAVFDSGGTPGNGGGLCTDYQTLAASDGSADDAVLTLTNNVTISGATPAATDYTDTITIVGAGLF